MNPTTWIAIIQSAAIIIGALAAFRWGRDYKAAVEAQLHAKDAEMATLRTGIEQLTGARDETIRTKDAQIATLNIMLEERRSLNPSTLQEYHRSNKEQLEEIIADLRSQLAEKQKALEQSKGILAAEERYTRTYSIDQSEGLSNLWDTLINQYYNQYYEEKSG